MGSNLRHALKEIILKFLAPFSDATFAKIVFFFRHKRLLRLRNPQTFNEKITYIKINSKNPLRQLVADRLSVRDYVNKRCPEIKLIDVLWSGKEFTEDVFDSLPNEFVIKGNHGSKMVKLVNKLEIDYLQLYRSVEAWMSIDYSSKGRERVYQNLDRYYLVEKRLHWRDSVPPDYKFFCFEGKVEMVQVDLNRFASHSRNLYDRNFIRLPARLHLENGSAIETPYAFEKAVKYAEELSVDFSFIRADLYLVGEDVYFGELTNFPGNGLETFYPRSYDRFFGEKIKNLK